MCSGEIDDTPKHNGQGLEHSIILRSRMADLTIL
jgi:hypothetical protein